MNAILKKTVLRILRPLVRYLMEQGWTYATLIELLKFVFVAEVIAEDMRHGRKQPTDSRVSLLSGVHRKEVRRLRSEMAAEHAEPDLEDNVSASARLVSAWATTPGFLGGDGRPLVLPLRASSGMPSFDELVFRLKADMRGRTILDDLVRSGVAVVEGESVRLLRTSYVSDVPEERLFYMGAHLGDHAQAVTHNLRGSEPPYFDQSMSFDCIPVQQVDEIRGLLRQQAEQLLHENYQRIDHGLSEADRSIRSGIRLRLGIYYYEEPATRLDGADGDRGEHDDA